MLLFVIGDRARERSRMRYRAIDMPWPERVNAVLRLRERGSSAEHRRLLGGFSREGAENSAP
jgi:hypothetical protein